MLRRHKIDLSSCFDHSILLISSLLSLSKNFFLAILICTIYSMAFAASMPRLLNFLSGCMILISSTTSLL